MLTAAGFVTLQIRTSKAGCVTHSRHPISPLRGVDREVRAGRGSKRTSLENDLLCFLVLEDKECELLINIAC